MRLQDQVHRDASPQSLDTWATETAHRSLFSETTHCPSHTDKCEGSYSPSDGPIAKATSWLMACLVQGFASHGEAMCPGLAAPGELIYRQEPKQSSQPGGHDKDVNGSGMLSRRGSHPMTNEDATRSADMQIALAVPVMSPVASFWSRVRRRRKEKLTITKLEALDDHLLRDIGLHRCQIRSVARHGDLYRW